MPEKLVKKRTFKKKPQMRTLKKRKSNMRSLKKSNMRSLKKSNMRSLKKSNTRSLRKSNMRTLKKSNMRSLKKRKSIRHGAKSAQEGGVGKRWRFWENKNSVKNIGDPGENKKYEHPDRQDQRRVPKWAMPKVLREGRFTKAGPTASELRGSQDQSAWASLAAVHAVPGDVKMADQERLQNAESDVNNWTEPGFHTIGEKYSAMVAGPIGEFLDTVKLGSYMGWDKNRLKFKQADGGPLSASPLFEPTTEAKDVNLKEYLDLVNGRGQEVQNKMHEGKDLSGFDWRKKIGEQFKQDKYVYALMPSGLWFPTLVTSPPATLEFPQIPGDALDEWVKFEKGLSKQRQEERQKGLTEHTGAVCTARDSCKDTAGENGPDSLLKLLWRPGMEKHGLKQLAFGFDRKGSGDYGTTFTPRAAVSQLIPTKHDGYSTSNSLENQIIYTPFLDRRDAVWVWGGRGARIETCAVQDFSGLAPKEQIAAFRRGDPLPAKLTEELCSLEPRLMARLKPASETTFKVKGSGKFDPQEAKLLVDEFDGKEGMWSFMDTKRPGQNCPETGCFSAASKRNTPGFKLSMQRYRPFSTVYTQENATDDKAAVKGVIAAMTAEELADIYMFMWAEERGATVYKTAGTIMEGELAPDKAATIGFLKPPPTSPPGPPTETHDRLTIANIMETGTTFTLEDWKDIFTDQFENYYDMCVGQNVRAEASGLAPEQWCYSEMVFRPENIRSAGILFK